jgi:4-amino-4-deoxy-L-arabinose transferase-like glycosyltransferase
VLAGRAARALEALVVLGAAAYVAMYLAVALLRIAHPFELEWMEGGVVEHVRRILEGKKIYVAPSIEFVPFIYTPLYYYLGAALSKVFGLGFVPLRALSLLCSLGCAALVFSFVRREVKHRTIAGLATALFLATYGASAAWLDLARVDSLFLLLALGAAWLVRFQPTPRGLVAAAVLISLSFFTKQNALLLASTLGGYLVVSNLRRAPWFVVPSAALIGGGSLWLDRIHDGWFWYYVFWLPQRHPWVKAMFADFWRHDLFPVVGIASLVGLLALVVRRRHRGFYLFFTAGLMGIAWSGRLHFGGWANTVLPAFVCIAVLAGIGMRELEAMVSGLAAPRREAMRLTLAICAAMQLGLLYYSPRKLVPRRRDLDAGQQLVERLRNMDGDVWVLGPGYLAARAGKRSYAHEWAIRDVLNFGGGPPGNELSREVREAIRERRFAAIVSQTDYLEKEISARYRDGGVAITDPKAFFAVTGTPNRPRTIWTR